MSVAFIFFILTGALLSLLLQNAFSLSLSHSHTHIHSPMVTETGLQRRLCESLIDHSHHFFPNLPALPSPAAATGNNKYSSVSSPTSSYSSSGYSTSPTVASSVKYTSLPSSLPQGYPPPSSPRPAEISAASSIEHLPHPLADHALFPSFLLRPLINRAHRHGTVAGSYSPPMPPRHGGNAPPASPVPKPRTGSSSSSSSSYDSGPVNVVRTLSGDLPENAIVENGQVENGPPPRYVGMLIFLLIPW